MNNSSNVLKRVRWLWGAALVLSVGAVLPARAAFHLWNIDEVYTNSSGTLQFVELTDPAGFQNFVNGMQISITSPDGTQTHTFTIPGDSLPGNTLNHNLLFATSGVQAAGGPPPDYTLPNGFVFPAGGTISFFGSNGGPYTGLPTDGVLSRTWNGGNAVNSPTNFIGQTGTVVAPEPTTITLLVGGGVAMLGLRRRRAV